MDKKSAINNFSRYAGTYDKYADVQRRAALELLKLAEKRDFRRILEIGTGTGNYTIFLKERFANAQIKTIDISEKMVEVASGKIKDKRIEFVVQDAEAVEFDGKFDLVTSNACFQWFEDLEAALKKYRKLLKEGGFILFSTFGPATLRELDISLKRLHKGISVSAGSFMGKGDIKGLLDENFEAVKIREVTYEESFPRLMGLLEKLKYSGTNGSRFGRKTFFTLRDFKRLEKIYLDKFGRIKATYQVFLCRGGN